MVKGADAALYFFVYTDSKEGESIMKTNIRIVKANVLLSTTASGYDYTHSYMHGYTFDLSRKTAALMRQSRKGAQDTNPESRLRQEGLVRTAIEIRTDHDPLM